MRHSGTKKRAISREAFSLVEQNYASIEDVDSAIKASLGIRLPVVGILQTYDFR
jgi:3-hydroxyacyl-CoA dehydrogenase